LESLVESIKENEGFRGDSYLDHLGNPTIGYGTLLPIDKEEAELLLKHRLSKFITEVENNFDLSNLSETRKHIIYEMAYQMGVPNLKNFKNMWKAIDEKNFNRASVEMINSRWYKATPNRAGKLAKKFQRG
jgi:lysozyme